MVKGGPSLNPSGRAKAVRADAAAPESGPDLRVDAGWSNLLTGHGVTGFDKGKATEICYEPMAPEQGLTLWLSDDIAKRLVQELPEEALSKGFDVKIGEEMQPAPPKPLPPPVPGEEASFPGKPNGSVTAPKAARQDDEYAGPENEPDNAEDNDPDADGDGGAEIKEWLDEQCKRLQAVPMLLQAAYHERACNGAALLMVTDDIAPMETELVIEKVKELRCLTLIESREMSPNTYYNDLQQPNYGEVETWRISPSVRGPGADPSKGAVSVVVHESRLIVFKGILVSKYQPVARDGFGDNIFTRVIDVMRKFVNAYASAGGLVNDFSQAVWAIKGLAQLLAMDGQKKFRDRVTAMELARSTLRATVVDADGESFQRIATSVTGLPELLDRFERRLTAAAEMPLTKLMGMSPGGLNATGESDENNWFAKVGAYRTHKLQPAIERIIKILLVTSGKKVKSWCIEWCPLKQLSALEEAQLALTVAQTDVANIGAQIYTPEEAAVAHYSGDEFKPSIKLDFSARAMADRMEAKQAEQQQALAMAQASKPAPGKGPPGAPSKVEKADAFDPDQPRDELGRFGEGGGSAQSAKEDRRVARAVEERVAIARMRAGDDAHRAARAAGLEPFQAQEASERAQKHFDHEKAAREIAQEERDTIASEHAARAAVARGDLKAPPDKHLKAYTEKAGAAAKEFGGIHKELDSAQREASHALKEADDLKTALGEAFDRLGDLPDDDDGTEAEAIVSDLAEKGIEHPDAHEFHFSDDIPGSMARLSALTAHAAESARLAAEGEIDFSSFADEESPGYAQESDPGSSVEVPPFENADQAREVITSLHERLKESAGRAQTALERSYEQQQRLLTASKARAKALDRAREKAAEEIDAEDSSLITAESPADDAPDDHPYYVARGHLDALANERMLLTQEGPNFDIADDVRDVASTTKEQIRGLSSVTGKKPSFAKARK